MNKKTKKFKLDTLLKICYTELVVVLCSRVFMNFFPGVLVKYYISF